VVIPGAIPSCSVDPFSHTHRTDDGTLVQSEVAGIGIAGFLAIVGHEVSTAPLPNLLIAPSAPLTTLGLIEGIADGLAGTAILNEHLDRRPVRLG
jgi:hypothetical protein